MKNVAIIQMPSVIFSDEKIHEICGLMHKRIEESGIACGPTVRNHKLIMGSSFDLSTKSGRFLVTVSVDADLGRETMVGPLTLSGPIVVFAEACRRFPKMWIPKRTIPNKWWQEFGEVFHQAVEAEFEDCEMEWLTEDEWVSRASYA